MPEVTAASARQLAWEAAKRALHPFRGFIFASSTRAAGVALAPDALVADGWNRNQDVDRAVILAALLSLFSVRATRTRPGFLIDAATYGSGKTLLSELLLFVVLGDDPAMISGEDIGKRHEER